MSFGVQSNLEQQVSNLRTQVEKATADLMEQRRSTASAIADMDRQHDATMAAAMAAKDDAAASLQRQHASILASMQVKMLFCQALDDLATSHAARICTSISRSAIPGLLRTAIVPRLYNCHLQRRHLQDGLITKSPDYFRNVRLDSVHLLMWRALHTSTWLQLKDILHRYSHFLCHANLTRNL